MKSEYLYRWWYQALTPIHVADSSSLCSVTIGIAIPSDAKPSTNT